MTHEKIVLLSCTKGSSFRLGALNDRVHSRQAAESVVFRPGVRFNGVKIFSATMFQDRSQLGEAVTEWMQRNPGNEVTEIVVTQSSDSSFHCVAFTVFYRSTASASA